VVEITHTRTDGTTADGTAKGDGSALRMATHHEQEGYSMSNDHEPTAEDLAAEMRMADRHQLDMIQRYGRPEPARAAAQEIERRRQAKEAQR